MAEICVLGQTQGTQIPLRQYLLSRSVLISGRQQKTCLVDADCQLLPRLAAGIVVSRRQQGRKFAPRLAATSLWAKFEVIIAHSLC